MGRFLWVSGTISAVIWLGASAPTQARDYPFCIKGPNYDSSVGDCSFDTYQQCLDTASGRGWCDRNPFYPGDAHLPSPKTQRRQRPQ